MGELLRKSLVDAPVVRMGDYHYFVHPLCDGVPAIDPALLREVTGEILARADLDVDKVLTVEAMGIPLATSVSLATGIPLVVVRKRRYGLPGEVEIGQQTGYSKGSLYVNDLRAGDRVLLVDDVISTGGTLEPLLRALHEMGVVVKDVVIAIEKGEGRARLEREHGVRIRTLQRIDVRDGRVALLD